MGRVTPHATRVAVSQPKEDPLSAKREAREIALERRVTRIDAAARDAGHAVGSWETEHGDNWSRATVRCSDCGDQAVVRVEDAKDGTSQWQGGKLAWTHGPAECAAARQLEASAV